MTDTEKKLEGYREVPSFPDYVVNRENFVRDRRTAYPVRVVRVSRTGGQMVNVKRDGKTYTRAAQALRKEAFPELYFADDQD